MRTLLFILALAAMTALPAEAQRLQSLQSQPFSSTSTSLLNRADVRAAVSVESKIGPLRHLGGTLQAIHAARQAYLADRAAGLAVAPFDEAVSLSAVAGERVIVDVFAHSDNGTGALASDLAALGFKETGRYRHVVSGWLPVDAIEEAAALSTLRAASAALATTQRFSSEQIEALRATRDARPGSIIGEASVALRVDGSRTQFGIDGTGVTIGVLSDSYDTSSAGGGAAGGVTSGDLPANVNVLDEFDNVGIDEGRAMIELAFDVAPGADFAFHTAFEGQASFAQGITDLRNAGSDVVVDDIIYFAEPYFQDGIIAQSADASFAAGVPYFSSAGNQANRGYEAEFIDSGQDAVIGGVTYDLHDFDPGPGVDTRLAAAQAGSVSYFLHYDEPSINAGAGQAPTSDYAIVTVQTGTTNIITFADTDNASTGIPFEISTLNGNGGFEIQILRRSGVARRVALAVFGGNSAFFEYDGGDSGGATSYGHANAAGAFGVGAAPWFNTPPFTAAAEAVPEGFTSYGGVLVRLNPDGTRKATAEDREKPDATASDADNNTFFGNDTASDPDTNPNFFGTSAAAPNLAAVAALMIEVAGGPGSLTPAQIYSTIENTADDITTADGTGLGYDRRTGNGFVRGDLAIETFAPGAAVLDGDPNWYLLASPTSNTTVDQLAQQNLVAGVPGFYPTFSGGPPATPTLYTGYDGTAWTPSTGTGEVIASGQGFLWYFWDQAFTPTEATTNASSAVAFPVGLTPPGAVNTADADVTLHADGNRINALGNPFGTTLDVTDVMNWPGGKKIASRGRVFVWDPDAATWRFGTAAPTVEPWQGFAVRAKQSAGGKVLTIPASAAGGAAPEKQAEERRVLAFELDGAALGTGRSLADRALEISFDAGADSGWDETDAEKFAPLANAFVVLGVEAELDGRPVLKAGESRAETPASFSVPLALESVGAQAALTLRWPTLETLPAEWTVTLRDLATGETIDLRRQESYAFRAATTALKATTAEPILRDADASGASTRFILSVETGVVAESHVEAFAFGLSEVAPNPVQQEGRVAFSLAEGGEAEVAVFDVQGRQVAVLAEGRHEAGQHEVIWPAGSLAPGVYVVRLLSDTEVATRRAVVVR
ncbi:MAG: T9SS type A sorting domain-containing protein [Bacteroidota bacterium]